MNKENWGIKRVCLGCGTRFYDFNKSKIICPNCNEEFDPEYLQKRKSKIDSEKEIIDRIDDVELMDDDSEIDDDDVSLNEAAE